MHYSKEIVNIQGLFVFTDGYVERTTYPLKMCYYFSTTINILFIAFFLLEDQATPDDGFPAYFDKDDKPLRIDHIWRQIPYQIDLYSGQPRFKHLAEFAKFHIMRVYLA